MIIEKLEVLCTQNGTNITALCKEITGSSGNLPTWKKDKIRPDWLRQICLKFNISSDYLLDLPTPVNVLNTDLSQKERDVLIRFNRLNDDYQIKSQYYMISLFEKQESWKNELDDLESHEEFVAADSSLKRTGTDNLGK